MYSNAEHVNFILINKLSGENPAIDKLSRIAYLSLIETHPGKQIIALVKFTFF